jgi:hypothetical protein
MKITGNHFSIFGTFLIVLTFPRVSFAYLDPGTGSLMLQGIIGAIAVAMATGKMWWCHVKAIFAPKKSSLKKEASDLEQFNSPGQKSDPKDHSSTPID